MEKVKKISIEKLNNKDFYQLIENVISISDTEPQLTTISAALKADIPEMKLSFKKESLTEETQQVVALDKKRDRAFMRLKSFLESETYNDEEPLKAEAANSLLAIIESFGGSKIPKFKFH
jgi:DNA polymerase III epsilon subunit-like protein